MGFSEFLVISKYIEEKYDSKYISILEDSFEAL